jgi:hypothetical protein
MIHVRWDTRGHPLAWLAPFPQHYASGKVGWEAVGEGWYHMSEYSAAKALFGERIHETEAWELAAYSTGAFTFVEAAYRTRAAYKAANDPRHFPLKVGLNALYGKLAESMTRDPTRRPAYQNFFLAGAVTAATRAKVLGVLAHVGRERAVMAATDGVFLLGADSGSSAGVDPLTGAGVRVGLGLGEWEVSSTPPGMVLAQAGVYWEVPQVGVIPKVRTRGFGVKSVSYDDAARLFRGTAPELSYRETRFIGLGYCVNTGDFSQWRRWVSVERTLSRSLEPYRRVEHGKVVAGVLHDAMQRRPYRPRNVRMTELPERPNAELLDALQMMEQPEGAGD